MLQTNDDRPKENWLDRPLLSAIHYDREKALYAILIGLAVVTRLWDLGTRVMSHDETVHIQWSWYLFRGQGYSHTPLSHGPFLFHATALSYYLFGDTDFSARLVVAIMGIVLVALPYLLRRWLGRTGALVTSLLLLISPSLLYYSRYIRHDIPIIVWSLIALAALFQYLTPKPPAPAESGPARASDVTPNPWYSESSIRWLIVLAAAISLMFATKEVAFIYIAFIGLFLILLFLSRLGPPQWHKPNWERWGKRLLWTAVGALLITTLFLGLSGVVDRLSAGPADSAAPFVGEDLGPDESATASTAATALRRLTVWGTIVMAAAVLGYICVVTVGARSHQRLILTAAGLLGVLAVAMFVFLLSLNLVGLFPVLHRDCGQAPIPGASPAEMDCAEDDCALIQGRCQRPIPVVAADTVVEFDETGTRVAVRLTPMEIFFAISFIAIIALLTGIGAYYVLKRLMPYQRGEWPTLDLIIFIGSLTLPFASALAINGLSRIASRLLFGIDAAFNSLDYTEAGLLRSAGFVFILLAFSVGAGLWWDWRRWLACATVFIVIFVVLFTTVFTNGNGLASGAVGSLGYWLEQQDVQRGSQPWYYYALLVPLYEYLPLFGCFAALFYVLIRGPMLGALARSKAREQSLEDLATSAAAPREDRAGTAFELEFVLFLLLWTAGTWLAYSFAGEKMPWLTTHFAVPMILSTGWLVGKLIDGTNWRTLWRQGGWIILILTPVLLAALVQTIGPWLTTPATSRPFSGYGLNQLNATMQFLSALLVLSVTAGILYWVARRIGVSATRRVFAVVSFAVLSVLTLRTAWSFAYVNHDYASEYLVYAHSTPDVREVMEQIEDISRRSAGELSLDVAYTGDGSYPFIWYLRNYPNAKQLPNPPSRPDLDKPVIIAGDKEWSGIEPYLGDNYTCTRHNFLWWPMQDYYGLTWERVRYAITNPEMRSALWDIIFRRDYRKYELATGKTVKLSEWPLRDQFRFCVRRDVLASVWSERAGPIDLSPVATEAMSELPDYAGLERAPAAELVVSALGSAGAFNAPHDMDVDDQGYIYVVDSNNHRVVKLSPDGQVVDTWDSTWWRGLQSWKPGCLDEADAPLALGDAEFCEPWGITVGPDGNVYVADTWNHRVQVFSADGEFLGKFGTFGQSGSSVSSAPSQFYGPRDVVIDQNGRIYVTDTGNKRIQVFDSTFLHQRSFGGPGIVEGRLEEPVGLAIGPDNLIYVADTWNNRMQAFTLEGVFVREWPIAGWDSQSVANKPFVASDPAGHIYVSDPEGFRILIFDSEGSPLAVIGGPGNNLFQLPSGVVLDEQDRLWVSDPIGQRLLRFPALDLGAVKIQP